MSGFYARLRDQQQHDQLLQDCIETVVNRLGSVATSSNKPAMLLGKIQSGKTRGFLGIIARCFDKDYDIALVFTKGTKTLARQTVSRITSDFKEFIDNEEISVYDIMEMPDRMTKSELKRKIIIVAKKEANNLTRMLHLITTAYPSLSERKMLLVDDEADMASVRFVKKKTDSNLKQGAIAQSMDVLRQSVDSISFLQVTATPYALYLQPEDYVTPSNQFVFLPKRPAFTALLPIHAGYVGGNDYFESFPSTDPRHYLVVKVPDTEQDALRSADGRTIRADRIWTSVNIEVLRRAVMTFLVSVIIRRWQQAEQERARLGKFAMIMHNDTQKAAHDWQWDTVELIREAFEKAAGTDDPRFKNLFEIAYADLKNSVEAHGGTLPPRSKALTDVKALIVEGELNVQRVNSDVQLAPLLDPTTAELKLRTQANIFIGGSILDRGITIPSLIAFYYGRNPKRMQADTVLQHSRMYGNRDRQDLAVTRFYTSQGVFDRLTQIHKLETTLRKAIEAGASNNPIAFIENDSSLGIVPCAPGKIAMSAIVTLDPSDIFLPTGFDTSPSPTALAITKALDEDLADYKSGSLKFSEISGDVALDLITRARGAMDRRTIDDFEWEAMFGLVRYYLRKPRPNKVDLLVERGRRLSKDNSGDKSGLSVIGGKEVRRLVTASTRTKMTLVMLRQDGKGLGWAGKAPFWWPLIVSPGDASPCVFAASKPG